MSELKDRKILVTGGAGFIGSHLVDILMQEGCYVRVLDNLVNGKIENLNQHKNNNKFEFILGSVISRVDVVKAVKEVDIVFHLACLGVRHSIKNPFENHRVNAEGALIVLEQGHKEKIDKFIYCSSSEVYGTAEYTPMPEEHPTHPNTVYGSSKLAGEAYTLAYYKTYGLKSFIIRPFNTYGPRSHYGGDAGEMIPRSIVRALCGKSILIFGDGSQMRDFTYVGDIARGLVDIAKKDEAIGKVFNMGSNNATSIKNVAEIIKEEIKNSSIKIEYAKSRPGDVLCLHADSTAVSRLTKWKPKVSFEEGIIKTIEWFKSRPGGINDLFECEKDFNWE